MKQILVMTDFSVNATHAADYAFSFPLILAFAAGKLLHQNITWLYSRRALTSDKISQEAGADQDQSSACHPSFSRLFLCSFFVKKNDYGNRKYTLNASRQGSAER